MDLSRYSSVVNLPAIKDDEGDFRQRVLDYVRGVMEGVFKTDVWDFEYEAVPLIPVGGHEVEDYCSHLKLGKWVTQAWFYDTDPVPEAWTPDELAEGTFKALEAYFKEKESEAKSRGVVGNILISDYQGSLMLPYREIGGDNGYNVMPSACVDYLPKDSHHRSVSADVFYYNSDDEVLAFINNEYGVNDDLKSDSFGCSVKDIRGGVEVMLDQSLDALGDYFHEHGSFPKSVAKVLEDLGSGVNCILFKVKGQLPGDVRVAYRYGACLDKEGIVNEHDNALNDFLSANTIYTLEDVYSEDVDEDMVVDAYPVWHLMEVFEGWADVTEGESLNEVMCTMCNIEITEAIDWGF